VRLLYLAEIAKAPDFKHPAVDAGFHDYWARGIATGNWTPPLDLPDPNIRHTPFLRPPGYPYFLAMIYRLSSDSYLAPRIVQMALGLVACGLVFTIGRRWLGRGIALLAAAGMALWWPLVYFEGELHATALLIPLLLSATYLLGLWAEKPNFVRIAGAGVLLGAGALVRPNALVLVPVGMVWTVWVARRTGPAKTWTTAPVALLLSVLLPIVPVTARNLLVADDFVLVSANAGVNLYIGNNEHADGTCTVELPELGAFGTCFDYPAIVKAVETKVGRPLKHSAVSSWLASKAARFPLDHPRKWARLTLRKLRLLVGPIEVGHNKELHFEHASSAVLRGLPGDFALVLACATVGLCALLSRKSRRPSAPAPEIVILTGLVPLALMLSILPFFMAARYRLPALPFLLLLGAVVPFRVLQCLRTRRFAGALLWVGPVAGLYALFTMLPGAYQPSLSKWQHDRGFAYLQNQELTQAARELTAALAVRPGYALAHYNLGVVLAKQGDPRQAIAHLREAVRLRPNLAGAHDQLGALLFRSGREEEAVARFHEALRIRPDQVSAHNNLGVALSERGLKKDAERHLREALRLNPRHADAHHNLGILLMSNGKLDSAIAHFRQSLDCAPHFAQAHNSLGTALAYRGQAELAVQSWRKALSFNPDYVEACGNLAWTLATHPDRNLRNGDEAVRLARRACRLTQYRNANLIDTLAAALAEKGQFDQAVRMAERAIGLASHQMPEQQIQAMRNRLEKYKASRPHRDTSRQAHSQ
jgi:tetratricopeptide (TPR) repeat protein